MKIRLCQLVVIFGSRVVKSIDNVLEEGDRHCGTDTLEMCNDIAPWQDCYGLWVGSEYLNRASVLHSCIEQGLANLPLRPPFHLP